MGAVAAVQTPNDAHAWASQPQGRLQSCRLLAAQRLAGAALEGRAITLRRHTEIKLLAWAGQL